MTLTNWSCSGQDRRSRAWISTFRSHSLYQAFDFECVAGPFFVSRRHCLVRWPNLVDSLQDCLVKIGVVEVTRGVSLTALPLRVCLFQAYEKGKWLRQSAPHARLQLGTSEYEIWLLATSCRSAPLVRIVSALWEKCPQCIPWAYQPYDCGEPLQASPVICHTQPLCDCNIQNGAGSHSHKAIAIP
jgi:hypothetical protein